MSSSKRSSKYSQRPNRAQRRAQFALQHQNEIGHESTSQINQTQEPNEHTRLVLWLRGVGFTSFSLGGVGLLTEYFYVAVALVYVGIVLLTLDLLLENFRNLIKALGVISLLVIVGAFSWRVVFHNNPLDMLANIESDSTSGTTDKVVLVVFISNGDDSADYKDLDVTLRTIPREPSMLQDANQITKLDGVTIFQGEGHLAHIGGEEKDDYSPLLKWNGSSAERIGEIANYKRIRCALLPHESAFQIKIDIDKSQLKNIAKLSAIKINGEFKGKFSKPVRLDQSVSIQSLIAMPEQK